MKVSEEVKRIHEQAIYPICRVIAGKAGGSGTIIYSRKDPSSEYDDFDTFVLTNHHVIEGLIKVETKYDPARRRDVKRQITQKAQVDIFRYRDMSVKDRDYSVDADVVAWDEDMDLGLLKLDSVDEVDYVASLYPLSDRDIKSKRMPRVHVADRVAAVGAALLNAPVFTEGRISRMFEEIDNFPYCLSTAPTIFGNSGGAVYRLNREGNWQFIGVPARISVSMSGFSADAITHLSWSIPIFTVYRFLKDSYFEWIYNPSISREDCEKLRERDIKRAEIDAVLSAQEAGK